MVELWMTHLRMEQRQAQQMRQEQRQVLRMEQADLLEMPEDEFHRLIVELEHSPLFRRLYQGEKVIRYQRFPRTDVSSSFYQLREEIVAGRGSSDVESLLLNREHLVSLIQRLGREKFKQYFLFPESGMTPEEIARECDLDLGQVEKINSLIDEVSVMSAFYHPSAVTSGSIRYAKVASVEKDGESFAIGYFSPAFARGRYSIDYGRFEELTASGRLTDAEAREAKKLFRKLELVNSRKDTLSQILQNIVEKQALYLESGDLNCLLPASQSELAKKIGVAPSSVSRAISRKSIETPWGAELPLKQLFPRPKRFKMQLLRRVLESEAAFSGDEAIRARLQERFGVAISRRSVANLRKELRFPAAQRRGRHSEGRGTR